MDRYQFKAQINPDHTCKLCGEPMEDVPGTDLCGAPIPEKVFRREHPPVTRLLCLACRIELRDEGYEGEEFSEPIPTVQPLDEETARRRMIESINRMTEEDVRRQR